MTDVASDIDGEVTTDGTWGRCQWVGGTEEGCKGERVRMWKKGERGKFGGWGDGLRNYLLRPVLTASRPSQTMAQIGPEFMSMYC